MRAWMYESSSGLNLSITGLPNRPQLLYRLAAVLFAYDWNIRSAMISTATDFGIEDRFVISPLYPGDRPDPARFARMLEDYDELLNKPLSVYTYLERFYKELSHPQTGMSKISYGRDPLRMYVRISVPDRPGLLLSILHVFALMNVDILEAGIVTDPDGLANNTFLVNPSDERFEHENFRTLLGDAFRILL